MQDWAKPVVKRTQQIEKREVQLYVFSIPKEWYIFTFDFGLKRFLPNFPKEEDYLLESNTVKDN